MRLNGDPKPGSSSSGTSGGIDSWLCAGMAHACQAHPPEQRRAVLAGGGRPAAVRREGKAPHLAAVRLQHLAGRRRQLLGARLHTQGALEGTPRQGQARYSGSTQPTEAAHSSREPPPTHTRTV